jgi:hypothetical protein
MAVLIVLQRRSWYCPTWCGASREKKIIKVLKIARMVVKLKTWEKYTYSPSNYHLIDNVPPKLLIGTMSSPNYQKVVNDPQENDIFFYFQ